MSTVLTPRRLKNLFATISKATEGMARQAGLLIDLELFWYMHPENEAAVAAAEKANEGKNLRWWDRRTRGWKLYEARRAAFFAKYGK